MNRWALFIATLGPVGYFPAPGTIATCCMIPVIYGLYHIGITSDAYLFLVIMSAILALLIVNRALWGLRANRSDPSEIVLDEAIGCMVMFVGIPVTGASAILGIIAFRILDISKWGPVGYVEKFSGAWGIMADDIVAGLIAHIVLRCVL